MNIIIIICFIIISRISCDEYEKISLVYESNNYYIPVKISQNTNSEYYILSNLLSINFFPSSKCSICKSYHIDESDTSYSLIKNNVSVSYYSLNFSGDLYESNLTLGTQTKLFNFIAFDSITNVQRYSGKGRFSLSFLNYYFNTKKKIFALSLGRDSGELDLGGYNENKIQNISNLNIFNVIKTNYNDSREYENLWYINFNKLSINGNKIENHKNNFKLTLDVSTNSFHIPKDFFFSNAHLIFSPDSKCQVQPEGYFICICNSDYKQKFGNFQFKDENNNIFDVKVTDYIGFDDSETGNHCYVSIEINYETDLFIAGKYVMNNYYTIFDIDNSLLKIYPDENGNFSLEQISVIIFLFSLCIGGLFFICCYIIYHKFCKRNRIGELNENLVQDNQQQEGNISEEINQQQNINEIIENNDNVNNNGNSNNNEEENLDNEKIFLREDNIFDSNNNAYNGNEDSHKENNINYNESDNCINDIRNSSSNL